MLPKNGTFIVPLFKYVKVVLARIQKVNNNHKHSLYLSSHIEMLKKQTTTCLIHVLLHVFPCDLTQLMHIE